MHIRTETSNHSLKITKISKFFTFAFLLIECTFLEINKANNETTIETLQSIYKMYVKSLLFTWFVRIMFWFWIFRNFPLVHFSIMLLNIQIMALRLTRSECVHRAKLVSCQWIDTSSLNKIQKLWKRHKNLI